MMRSMISHQVMKKSMGGYSNSIIISLLVIFSGIVNSQSNNYTWTPASYKEALSKGILFFEGQRSGKLPASQRVTWRGDSALTDGNYTGVDLTGGYYDAGDNVKFVWPMSFTIALLSWAAVEYGSDIGNAGELANLHTAIKWGTDFLIKAHPSATTFYTQVGDGNRDHSCWERPEDMDTLRTVYKIDTNTPGSEAAADAAAAFAAASIVFSKDNPSYSATLLAHSKSLFDFADKYQGSYQQSSPFYISYSGFKDELLWAAAWLYKATGDGRYLTYVISNKGWSQTVSEFSWDNKFAGAQTLLAKEFLKGNSNLLSYKSNADLFVCALIPGSNSLQIRRTPGGLLYIRDDVNLQYVTSASMVLLVYSKALTAAGRSGVQCGSTMFSNAKIREFAKSQVDYIMGNNPMRTSYMTGFGTKFPTRVHHRGASIPSIRTFPQKVTCGGGYGTYYSSPGSNPNIHVGALVGGPDSNDKFSDSRSDYSEMEPTTYMNAAFVGAVAAFLSG